MFNFLFHKHDWQEIAFSHLYENVYVQGKHLYSKSQQKNYAIPVSVKTFKCPCGQIKYDSAYGHVDRWEEPKDKQ